jgi:lambda repressor-like predicted transcriptional regulator
MDKRDQRIVELEDALKDKELRIEELREERDRQAETIKELREQLEALEQEEERWPEAFEMEATDDGKLTWKPWLDARLKVLDEHIKLIQDYNKLLGKYLAHIAPRNFGRPLAASGAQRQRILALRKAGHSLRSISDETHLGLQTVRTVIDKSNRVDRTTLSHLKRVAPDRFALARMRRSNRDIAALAKRRIANRKRSAELIKAAKGLR